MNLSENSRYKYFVSRYRPRIYIRSAWCRNLACLSIAPTDLVCNLRVTFDCDVFIVTLPPIALLGLECKYWSPVPILNDESNADTYTPSKPQRKTTARTSYWLRHRTAYEAGQRSRRSWELQLYRVGQRNPEVSLNRLGVHMRQKIGGESHAPCLSVHPLSIGTTFVG